VGRKGETRKIEWILEGICGGGEGGVGKGSVTGKKKRESESLSNKGEKIEKKERG